LVANSPGLIAGSNVLHRLLVPRHPPIALSSLSQQQKQNYATKRCSRPLYSSQNTGRNTSHNPPLTSHSNTPKGNNPPSMHHHQQFDGSRPQPPTTPDESSAAVTQKKQSKPPEQQLRESGPIPQDPTARLGPSPGSHSRSTRPLRRGSAVLACSIGILA
jgi:hypothetical protein